MSFNKLLFASRTIAVMSAVPVPSDGIEDALVVRVITEAEPVVLPPPMMAPGPGPPAVGVWSDPPLPQAANMNIEAVSPSSRFNMRVPLSSTYKTAEMLTISRGSRLHAKFAG
jgi:hypothetical protein